MKLDVISINNAMNKVSIYEKSEILKNIEKTEVEFKLESNPTIITQPIYSGRSKNLSGLLNLGIKQLTNSITLLSDSDVTLYPNYEEIVTSAHETYPLFDIITFRLNSSLDLKVPHRHYPTEDKLQEILLGMNFYEISFKTKSIKGRFWFDEQFGRGTSYTFGECYIFISDCLKKGLKIIHLPDYIGHHAELYYPSVAAHQNKSKSLGAIECKYHGWKFVLNYINVYINKTEIREARTHDGLRFLNHLNLYLQGACEFKQTM